MTRFSVAVAALAVVAVSTVVSGCREEPTIVIKFEPNDLSGASAAGAAGKPADLGTRAATAGAADLAVAAKTPTSTTGDKAEAKSPRAAAGKQGKVAECKTAADCVLVPLDCCDCANGGKQHAIAKNQASAEKTARAEKCKTAVCTMMLSTDPSCGQRSDCVDGACVMVKK